MVVYEVMEVEVVGGGGAVVVAVVLEIASWRDRQQRRWTIDHGRTDTHKNFETDQGNYQDERLPEDRRLFSLSAIQKGPVAMPWGAMALPAVAACYVRDTVPTYPVPVRQRTAFKFLMLVGTTRTHSSNHNIAKAGRSGSRRGVGGYNGVVISAPQGKA